MRAGREAARLRGRTCRRRRRGGGRRGLGVVAAGAENRTRVRPPDVLTAGRRHHLFHLLHDLLEIEHPTYVDVGGAHPVQSNNTYLLYGTGSTGVLVEPNPMYVEMLRRQRPNDVVVAAGIAVTDETEADCYEIRGNPLLNTFSAEQVEKLQDGTTEDVVERTTKMPLININRVIAEHLGSAPDLLSTDVEGLDGAIVRSLNLEGFRPGVICCEGVAFDTTGRRSALVRFLARRGYIVRGGSMINTVLVNAARLA
jgi:FkbM family methyltransferase